jgi:zinc protease
MKTTKKIAASALVIGAGLGFFTQSAWALLPIEHWTQPSGAQVWLVQSPGIPMVDMQLDFDAGSRRDPQDKAGLASAMAMMAAKGIKAAGDAPALDENGLGQAWADLGASFGANAGRDSFTYGLRSLTQPDLLQKAVALAARQIATPSWPDAVWQRDRERISAAIKEADTRPGTIASKAFRKDVYGTSPYGYQTTVDSLTKIDISAMQEFHRQLIAACRAKVSVVGAVSRQQADAMVKQLLGPLQATNGNDCTPLPEVAKVQDLTGPKVENIPFESAQAQVIVGQPGIARNSPDFLAVMLGNHILGGGGFTSRLMEEVREKRGLTYGVSSDFSPGLDRGAFVIGLQTRPDQAAEALKVSQDVLRKFIAEGPTEKELKAAKDNLIGGFALRIDSNRKLLGNVSNIAWNGLPLDYLEHWTDRVQALTTKDVKEAMQRMVQPERMVTVILGAKP